MRLGHPSLTTTPFIIQTIITETTRFTYTLLDVNQLIKLYAVGVCL